MRDFLDPEGGFLAVEWSAEEPDDDGGFVWPYLSLTDGHAEILLFYDRVLITNGKIHPIDFENVQRASARIKKLKEYLDKADDYFDRLLALGVSEE